MVRKSVEADRTYITTSRSSPSMAFPGQSEPLRRVCVPSRNHRPATSSRGSIIPLQVAGNSQKWAAVPSLPGWSHSIIRLKSNQHNGYSSRNVHNICLRLENSQLVAYCTNSLGTAFRFTGDSHMLIILPQWNNIIIIIPAENNNNKNICTINIV